MPAKSPSPKVFIIGFNKCGTSSFHQLFAGSGLRSVHWQINDKRYLANVMFGNKFLSLPILHGIDRYDCYSDMSFLTDNVYLEANLLFRELHAEYPDALFVLNTRNRDRWVRSRLQHWGETYIARFRKFLAMEQPEIVGIWERQWDLHHAAVRDHFGGNDRFLEFDIETDDADRLGRFLNGHGVPVDMGKWTHRNKTASKPAADPAPSPARA